MNNIKTIASAINNRTAHAVLGIVSSVDPVNHAIKVKIQPDNVETGWLPDAGITKAGTLRIASPADLGMHVVLLPIEGDGEHYVVIGSVFDTVIMPPVSPMSGKVAQPGEWLLQAGCQNAVFGSQHKKEKTSLKSGWCHVGDEGIALGAGNSVLHIKDNTITFKVGHILAELTADGLTVTGGDIKNDQHSLNNHIHTVNNRETSQPIG
ncbi:phage baseplate assembly protein V [Swingsia samuiensis]|uniref:Baseplate assembly protein n=1 Tax=Swingsia samuiensis TaxID=1293412 RepID=A0A4Y6UIY2_9PROT|nr:phage baseplate assembly protein V [Swingsia samuiensis]QDH16780.1 baseplate assembly protein [Swingsia samuiensis]